MNSPAAKPFNFRLIPIAAVLLALLTLLGWQVTRGNRAVQVGDVVPNFALQPFASGDAVAPNATQLSDWRGKVVVINFWASWCVPCKTEAAELESFWQAHAKHDVILLGLAYTDLEAESLDFLRTYQLTYPNAPDIGNRISRIFRIRGVPETYIIGQDGRLVQQFIGPTTAAQLTAAVQPLLEQP